MVTWKSRKVKPSRRHKNRRQFKMTFNQFIEKNKALIDASIKADNPNTRIDSEERHRWVLEDTAIHNLAIRSGVIFYPLDLRVPMIGEVRD